VEDGSAEGERACSWQFRDSADGTALDVGNADTAVDGALLVDSSIAPD
jgi:hypothetical protein